MSLSALKEYHIGWICALPIEAAAALEMLDEYFGTLEEQDKEDTNIYSLGRIGEHYIVIACPGGQYHDGMASDAAVNMMRTFSDSVQVVLMVGIGGGIPSAIHDIRLGDIVISCPTGTFGGVIQHDMRRIGEDGKVTCTGSLNSPPQVLLTAVNQMRDAAFQKNLLYPSFIQQATERNQQTQRNFARPGTQYDRFFQFQHVHPPTATSCDGCLAEWEVSRDEREDCEPHLHYGIITSGNAVIKSGKTREQLQKDTGALCVEMGATGLMFDFPCIVIRGICDYADSHMNKQWQGYAALAAASYTKELLGYVPRSQVSEEKLVADASTILAEETGGPSRNINYVNKGIDLQRLKPVKAAAFDSYENQHVKCLLGTQIGLLSEVEEWTKSPHGKSIFWLSGLPGTGKSTISRTVASHLKRRNSLGASFFFKRGQEDQGNAKKLFPTLANQLVISIPQLFPSIQKAIEDDPNISEKGLRLQFAKLLLQPLLDIKHSQTTTIVIVIDALDECERDDDIHIILQLLPQVQKSSSVQVRFFLTSRPEVSVTVGFKEIINDYQCLTLQEISMPMIKHDISLFLMQKFSHLRKQHSLPSDWPGDEIIKILAERSGPLFSSADTLFRFISDANWNPKERLRAILADKATNMSTIGWSYMAVLNQIFTDQNGQKPQQLIQGFKEIIGVVVLLVTPLSINALAQLLDKDTDYINYHLDLLHSVLAVPNNLDAPVRLLHVSFRDFLLDSEGKSSGPFLIDEKEAHENITIQCLKVMTQSLQKDIFKLSDHNIHRAEINMHAVHHLLPQELHYSCHHWAQHLTQSKDPARLLHDAFLFLEKHFLHWVEVMSILGAVSKVVGVIYTLQNKYRIQDSKDPKISEFLYDAWRFTLKNMQIAETTPLQLYSSALVFAPKNSIIRKIFYAEVPSEMSHWLKGEEFWGAELQDLEGHCASVQSVAFSPDGQLLASGSVDQIINILDSTTGVVLQTLEGHSVAFSPDGRLLASGSIDQTIKLWKSTTGDLLKTLQGHSASVQSVAFSPGGRLLASGSDDKTIKLWDLSTGTLQQILMGHSASVQSVAFSPGGQHITSGSIDETVKLWEVQVRKTSNVLNDRSLDGIAQDEMADDDISDISAEDSLWSGHSTEYSRSSFGGLHVSQGACEKLAEILCKDPDLRRLYLEAFSIFGKERFSKNHDKILKKFFKSLRLEVNDSILHLQTVRLLRYPSSRGQVTEWIHRLCIPSPDLEVLRSRQAFLNQKESREEILSRFLQSQIPGGGREEEFDNEIRSDGTEGEGDDEPSSEDTENEMEPMHFEELQKVINFITSGRSYEFLKSNIYLLVHPPTSIPEAIQLGGVRSLRKLLEKQFNRVATGEYAWVREVSEAGYSYYDIADLLCQDAVDAPWIYFEPQSSNLPEIRPKNEAHVRGCVHCFGSTSTQNEAELRSSCHEAQPGPEKIQELCGLAGITPNSRDPSECKDAVTFKEQNSVAIISYAGSRRNSELDRLRTLHRITTALDRFCAAAGHMQVSSICCDSFTVIIHQAHESEVGRGPTAVSLYRISFLSTLQLLAELKALSPFQRIAESDLTNVMKLLCRILEPMGFNHSEIFRSTDLDEVLHMLSLAVQFLSLGLLSYNQGHVGPIQPFFLDTPQRKIILTGSKACGALLECIIAEPTNLTCIGDMVGGPVLTFKIYESSKDISCPEDGKSFDLLATPEDLLDTWGPGSFIVHRNLNTFPCAMKICGGIIYAPTENALKFHWSRSADFESLHSVFMNPSNKICIGSFVAVNMNCNINEQECWNRSVCAFENLGVHDEFWAHAERQVGFQAGNYIMLQANITKHKLPGKTLKKMILEQDTEMLIPELNCLWGLQVSFCTGVTKRVPLRELIADVLPTFAKTFIQEQALWDELKEQHHILDAFRTDAVQDWLKNLNPKLYSYLLRVVQRIIFALKSTGVDPEGKFLSAAWPYDGPPIRCFRISRHDRTNSWIRVLADSEDCATFAYISTNCLVTDKVQCRGPSPLWHSTTPLLETAILRHNENPSNLSEPLESKRAYFFKKLDSLLRVEVERQPDSGTITLSVSPSSAPARFQQRLYRMDIMRNQWTRIREKQSLSEYAEHVAVIAKNEAGT